MKKILIVIAIAISFPSFAAEQCLVPNAGYAPTSCDVEVFGGGGSWLSLMIKTSDKTLYTLEQGNVTILSDKESAITDGNSQFYKAKKYWLDSERKATKSEGEGHWSCFKQNAGPLSICVPAEWNSI